MEESPHDRLLKVIDVCTDDAEILALSVTRFIAGGYMTRDVACWDAAYDAAERMLGEESGPAFVAGMIMLMRAIRAERKVDWSFMPATCCRMTADERELVGALSFARYGTREELGNQAARLVGDVTAPRTAAALLTAAQVIEASHDRFQRDPPCAAEDDQRFAVRRRSLH